MENDLDKYVQATIEAGNRSRKLVYFLAFSSIVSFMAAWNSRQSSWTDSRYKMVTEAYNLYLPKGIVPTGEDIIPRPMPNAKISPKLKDSIDTFLQNRSIKCAKDLEDLRKLFFELRKETYRVSVPFFCVSFDINDLGIFSGLTLSFLLLLFWFSIRREKDNLGWTLSKATERKQLEFYYNYLAMAQVLTNPPKRTCEPSIVGRFLTKRLFKKVCQREKTTTFDL